MSRGYPGSAYQPDADTNIRLARWRARACRTRSSIAAALGMKRAALDKTVCRARQHGHPDAILHPNAQTLGSGTWHLTGRKRSKPRT